MTGLSGSAAVDAAVNAYYETEAHATQHIPGAYVREGAAGTRLVVWTIPDPKLNVVRVDGGRDPREVEEFVRELSSRGLPGGIQVRGDAGPELAALGARYGRTGTSKTPLLRADAAEALSSLPAALPPGATVREVTGQDGDEFAAMLAAGFEIPEYVARLMSSPGLLDAPGITGFLLDLHGEPVATGLNVLVGESVGIYCASVLPGRRGNGYYRALLTASLLHAVARGARHAVCTNTPMSRPLFESAGFRLATTWTNLVSAS